MLIETAKREALEKKLIGQRAELRRLETLYLTEDYYTLLREVYLGEREYGLAKVEEWKAKAKEL